jgi:hypothetical protein
MSRQGDQRADADTGQLGPRRAWEGAWQNKVSCRDPDRALPSIGQLDNHIGRTAPRTPSHHSKPVRRSQDDDRSPRSAHASLRHRRDRQRELALLIPRPGPHPLRLDPAMPRRATCCLPPRPTRASRSPDHRCVIRDREDRFRVISSDVGGAFCSKISRALSGRPGRGK